MLLSPCPRRIHGLTTNGGHYASTQSLIGHLLYGAVSASIFLAFERQKTTQIPGVTSHQTVAEALPTASAAPALCLFALGIGPWPTDAYAVGVKSDESSKVEVTMKSELYRTDKMTGLRPEKSRKRTDCKAHRNSSRDGRLILGNGAIHSDFVSEKCMVGDPSKS